MITRSRSILISMCVTMIFLGAIIIFDLLLYGRTSVVSVAVAAILLPISILAFMFESGDLKDEFVSILPNSLFSSPPSETDRVVENRQKPPETSSKTSSVGGSSLDEVDIKWGRALIQSIHNGAYRPGSPSRNLLPQEKAAIRILHYENRVSVNRIVTMFFTSKNGDSFEKVREVLR